jgi:hypothetical protein
MRNAASAASSMLMLCLLSASAAVSAAGQMKPGLWEMTMKSDAMKNMPKIPPEQMEQMRKMGIAMPQMQDGGIVQKVCITKEMAERDGTPEMHTSDAGCEPKNFSSAGNSYSGNIICNGPTLKGEGKVKGTFSGNQSFSSTYEFKGTAEGQPVNQRSENSGKWLSADCGSVKPVGEAMRSTKKQ